MNIFIIKRVNIVHGAVQFGYHIRPSHVKSEIDRIDLHILS